MIKFFRHIRKSLLNEGKTSKYFKYAIGEIVLVVIGILIALQINNWNEQRKENQFERKVLKEILSDTEEDIIETNNGIKSLKEAQISSKMVLVAFYKNLKYKDSMDIHFAKALAFWSLSPNSTAFETAKTEGLNLIKNDSIRHRIAKVNTFVFDYVKVLENRWQDYDINIVQPHCLSLFDYYNTQRMKPTNYENLKEDMIYQGILKSLTAKRTRYTEILEIRHKLLITLNKELKDELNND